MRSFLRGPCGDRTRLVSHIESVNATDAALGQDWPLFPESEQGVGTERNHSPASLGVNMALEWNPEFTLKAEPGYEQCREEGSEEETTSHHEGLLLLHRLEAAVTKL